MWSWQAKADHQGHIRIQIDEDGYATCIYSDGIKHRWCTDEVVAADPTKRIANDKNSDKHVFNHCIKIDQKLSFFSFTDLEKISNFIH